MNRPRALAAAVALLALAPGAALAFDPEKLEGWWAGADIGYASMTRRFSAQNESTTQHKMITGLRVGYSWDPRLLLGVEAANWLLKGANMWRLNEGEGIQTFNFIAQAYPAANRWWVKAGLGGARFWTDVPEEGTGRGFGGVLGFGYDVPLWGAFRLTPAVDFAWGRIKDATSPAGVKQDQDFRAFAFKIGLTFR